MEHVVVGGRTFGLELINDGNNLAVVEQLADGAVDPVGTLFVGVLAPPPPPVFVEPDPVPEEPAAFAGAPTDEGVTESGQHADT